jgi:succinyl-diaminopimelate desuccinylase
MVDAADPVALTRALIACRSVTPEEGGALTLLVGILSAAGFTVTRKIFSAPGTPDVENLFATIGTGGRHLVFGGHTDVVPPGDPKLWTHQPFEGVVAGGNLYGRGAVDMKGGIACFVAALVSHLGGEPPAQGRVSLAITGDEEGPSINGTVKLLAWAAEAGHRFDAALVGEPTSQEKLGDTIKIGRRGSVSGEIVVTGKQGHVAYPHQADNPVPRLVRLLSALDDLKLDSGNDAFDPSNLEIVSVDVGNPAFNVIPASARARFNVRFNDQWTPQSVEAKVRATLDAAGAGGYALTIQPGASEAFLTTGGGLAEGIGATIRRETGVTPTSSTSGGTSDARFFKNYCPVIEFGLVNRTIHQVDEHVAVADLHKLTAIYRGFIADFLSGAHVSRD